MSEKGSDADSLREAREGNVDALFALASKDPHAAYFWLLVAQDFGHEAASDRMNDIEECYNEFKYDDDGLARMDIQRRLGEAYIKGERGLEQDLERGIEHLGEYLCIAQTAIDGGGLDELQALAAQLDDDRRQAVETCIEDQPFRDVRRRVERTQHFWDLLRSGAQIPTVVVEAELEALMKAASSLAALVRKRI